MEALLDINVLIALFDASHHRHEAAHEWLSANLKAGWASCPLTENGFVRVISNPAYPGRRTTLQDAVERLRKFTEHGAHSFWPDSVSLLTDGIVRFQHLKGHQQITDAYLLALAVTRNGRLATFDTSIRTECIQGARSQHLVHIPAAG